MEGLLYKCRSDHYWTQYFMMNHSIVYSFPDVELNIYLESYSCTLLVLGHHKHGSEGTESFFSVEDIKHGMTHVTLLCLYQVVTS